MRRKNRVKLWVFHLASKQLWRLTLVIFLLSLCISSLWQLMIPPHSDALVKGYSWNSMAQSEQVQWHWAELLAQGFPWLRSSAPAAFQSPYENIKRLVGACIGFVPGNASLTAAYALPWLREASAHHDVLAQTPEEVQPEVKPATADLPAKADARNYSLLPVFAKGEILALQGDLAPVIDPAQAATAPDMQANAATNDEPVVQRTSERAPILIFHTHNAEAFQASGDTRYVYNNDSRTVVYIGDILAQKLEEQGVPVVHDRTHHMDANFNLAYVQARRTLQRQLNEGEFSMILDIHNDGTLQEITTCEIDGRSLARMLLVIGKADGIGTSWKLNEAFASAIHQGLQEAAPGLSRGLYYEPGVRYNQDIHPASLIIEMGGNENSLDEALRSVDYLAQVLSDLYYNGW